MKKRFFALGTALVVLSSLVGCLDSGPNQMPIYMLTKMETAYAPENSKPNVVSTYTFRQIRGTAPDPNDPNRFSDFPEVVCQTITGDTLTRIDYSYNVEKRSVTASRHHVNGTVYVDSLGLNLAGMAASVLREGQAPVPYSIVYTPNSGIYRTEVGKTKLSTEVLDYDVVYRSATVDGEVVAEYYYLPTPNYIKLQQHTIPGAPYYWATDRFGGQSAYLLKYSDVMEDGVKVRYEFNYQFTSRGFVSKEEIKRNGQLFITNTYHYTVGVIEW